MSYLNDFLTQLVKSRKTYDEGVRLAKMFVENNNGSHCTNDMNETELNLRHETAICFQLYQDIDRFYYES